MTFVFSKMGHHFILHSMCVHYLTQNFPTGGLGTGDPSNGSHAHGLFFGGGGTVKEKVFARRPRTVEDMSQFILEACQEIDANEDLCSLV